MEIKIDLKTLLKIKQRTMKDYANALNMVMPTLRCRFRNPKQMKIEECNLSDKFLNLPNGTTHAVVNGNVMFNDIIEYING